MRREVVSRLRFDSMGAETQDRPKARLAAFLDEQYRGDFRWKRLAQDIRCSEKQAENLFAGHWPTNDLIIEALVERFQEAFLDAVLRPAIDREQARLATEARRHLSALADIERRARVAGPVDARALAAVGGALQRLTTPGIRTAAERA